MCRPGKLCSSTIFELKSSIALVQAGHTIKLSSSVSASSADVGWLMSDQPTSADQFLFYVINSPPCLNCSSLPAFAAFSTRRFATRLLPCSSFTCCSDLSVSFLFSLMLALFCTWGLFAAALPASGFPCMHMEGQGGTRREPHR